MPAFTQYSASNYSCNMWVNGCSNCHTCLGTWGGGGTYCYTLDAFGRAGICNPQSLPGDATGITSATNSSYNMKWGTATGNCYNWDGNSWSYGGAVTLTSYQWFSTAHDAARLTVAYINSDWIAVQLNKTGGGNDIRSELIQRSGTYVVGGPWFQILSCWIGPALFGTQLTFDQIFRAAKSAILPPNPIRCSVRYFDWEIEEMWKSYKNHEYKFPTYFHMMGKASVHNLIAA